MSFFKPIKICFVFLLIIFEQVSADVYYLGGMFTQHYRDGTYAEWGKYSRLGAKIAIKHINDEERLDGDKILMPDENIIDYHCWNENVELMTQSLIRKNVLAIIGAECSDPAVIMANTSSKANIPIISYGANAAELSNKKKFPYFLRVITPSEKYERYLLDLASNYGANKIAFFHTTDSWGQGAAMVVMDAAKKKNIRIVKTFSFPRDASQEHIDGLVRELKETDLRHIFLTSPTPDTVRFFKAINKYGFNNPGYFIYASEMILNNTPLDAVEGAIGYFSPVAGISDSKKLDYYIETYEELTGLNADFNSANFIYSVLSYDQVILVSEAIKSTKKKNLEVTSENVMSQLRLANFQGASGEISFENDSNDRLNMPVKIMKFLGMNDKGQMSFIPIASTDAVTGYLKIITK